VNDLAGGGENGVENAIAGKERGKEIIRQVRFHEKFTNI
jgi:hypothetical protein